MRRTFPTACPWCKSHVYYHTNGNGDCVYFDAITGPPWPVHDCWERRPNGQTRAQWERDQELRKLSALKEIATGSRPVVIERIPGESAVDRILRERQARQRAHREYLELKSQIRRRRRRLNSR